MAYINETFRIHYISKNFTGGLTDVRMVVYKPNGVKQGVYILSEVNQGDGAGIYYYDYVDSDIEGSYLFVINSPSLPKKDSKQVTFKRRTWTEAEKEQIRDALGVNGDKTDAIGGQLQTIRINVDFIRGIEGGNWEILDNQMIFKDELNVEIARFDLFGEAGAPTEENAYKRVKV